MTSLRTLLSVASCAIALGAVPGLAAAATVDDFESGLPAGTDGDGILLGFHPFQGSGTVAIATTSTPPSAVPGAAAGNTVLQMSIDTDTFGGVVHVFENPAVDALAPRDWSAYDTITFWLYGNGSGADLYIDVLDNRGPTGLYPFELWTTAFKDDFSGWKQLSFAFADLVRKEIGNGAPDDGLGLTTVHGWALGVLDTTGPRTYYLDDVQLVATIPEPAAWALFSAGLLMTLGATRRRRH